MALPRAPGAGARILSCLPRALEPCVRACVRARVREYSTVVPGVQDGLNSQPNPPSRPNNITKK